MQGPAGAGGRSRTLEQRPRAMAEVGWVLGCPYAALSALPWVEQTQAFDAIEIYLGLQEQQGVLDGTCIRVGSVLPRPCPCMQRAV